MKLSERAKLLLVNLLVLWHLLDHLGEVLDGGLVCCRHPLLLHMGITDLHRLGW